MEPGSDAISLSLIKEHFEPESYFYGGESEAS
jgi:hypothetical protein